jgi:hypothetical protein
MAHLGLQILKVIIGDQLYSQKFYKKIPSCAISYGNPAVRVWLSASGGSLSFPHSESATTRKAGGLDFTAIGGKRQVSEEPGIENPILEIWLFHRMII